MRQPRQKPPTVEVPSPASLQSSLETARRILSDPEEDWYPANTFKLQADFERLHLESHGDRTEALRRASVEVCPAHYCPPEPPGISAEKVCRGTLMLPFVWTSPSFQ